VGNLVENAVVHGGSNDLQLRVERDGVDAVLVVSDEGPGIAPEHLPMIFERFWRADQARRRGGLAGAGLGLAIARENANLIGADLTVVSDPGRGTRFTVRLPATVSESAAAR
jgi:signal transduction histidine kinase